LPEEWVPLMKIAYEELKSITSRMGVDVVLAGAGAYSVHVEADSTKDVDFILSKPLDVKMLVKILEELAERLEMRGFNMPSSPHPREALRLPRAVCRISARTRAHHPFQHPHPRGITFQMGEGPLPRG
jgi:hypothetical protein